MSEDEALVLITKAALIDPRMKRTDDEDRADMAEAWAAVLDDVSLPDALEALRVLQRTRGASEPAIQPADVLAAVGVETGSPAPESVRFDREYLQAEVRKQLAAMGMSESDYEFRVDVRMEVRRRMEQQAIEGPADDEGDDDA